MKKILCILLMIGLLLSVHGMAERALFPSEQTEQKLQAMIPILDSLASCLKVAESSKEETDQSGVQPVFNAQDDALVWSQLRALSEKWLSQNPEYLNADDETISVPAEVLDSCAAASFQGLVMAPMLSGVVTDGKLIYNNVDDTYVMAIAPADPHYVIIERNAQDGDDMVVNCGIYDPETDERLGGLTTRLKPAAEDALYPYSVADAHAETPDDFNGLWTNYCEIRYISATDAAANSFDTLPIPTATPTPEPTIRPTTTPRRSSSSSSSSSSSGSAYKRLSRGSRGSDVRDLQKRLNELGYDCGTPDGVYGAATQSAVRLFQNAIDVEENGVATASVQQKLFARNAPEYEKYTKLSKGDRGVRVEKLQDRLRELGYTGHPANGVYDNRIVEAVELFQESTDLDVNGIADVETQKALFSSEAVEYTEYITLEKDDSGIRVEEMQQQLVRLGYLSKVTKKYDSKTVKAVASFMKSHGYSGNGKTADAELIARMFTSSKSSSRKDEDEDEKEKEPETEPKEPEKEPETKPEKEEPAKQPESTPETEPEQPSAEPETPAEHESQSEPEAHSEPEGESPTEAEPTSPEKTEDHGSEESQKEESGEKESKEEETKESKEESSESSTQETRESEPESASEKESSESKSEAPESSPEVE